MVVQEKRVVYGEMVVVRTVQNRSQVDQVGTNGGAGRGRGFSLSKQQEL